MYAYDSYKKNYLMGADGQYHEVSEEIWNEYMRSVWCEKAARRREEGLAGSNCLPKVVSYESLTDAHGEAILPNHRAVEDEVVDKSIRAELHNRLYRALEQLGSDEAFLIGKLYLESDGLSIRAYAKRYGVPRTTVQYQRKRLLARLRAGMESEEGFSVDAVHAAFEQNAGR